MSYVDAFVTAVPLANRQAYQEMAERMARLFTECGALEVTDCWGEDVPEGKLTSFPLSVQRAPDEAVCVGWVVWPSRAIRDAGWKRALADPLMAEGQMPFDGKRMIFGGFDMIQQTRKGG